jgi:hypothetical protein
MVNKLLTIALAFACILLGYLLYNTLELYEEPVDAGWAFAAKRNPYLATELLLARISALAESSDSKSAIDKLDTFDSLLITNSGLVINQTMADALINWVNDGGELVIGANETRGKLLEQLGVEYKAVTYYYDEGEEPISGDRGWSSEDELSPVAKALAEYGDEKNKKACRKCAEDKTHTGCDDCATDDDKTQLESEKKLSDLLKEANKKNQERALAKPTSKPEVEASATSPKKMETIPARRTTQVRFKDYKHDVNAAFSPWSIITHTAISGSDATAKTTDDKAEENQNTGTEYTPFYWVSSQQGAHLMQFDIGDGMITVVSDASIWDSHQLGRLDHAFLLRSLGFRNTSLILYGVAMPSIIKLAWKKFPELIITFLLLIGFCLWQKAIRVGPIKQLNNSSRRSIMDSIQGLASYQHKRKKYSRLLQPVITDILLLANRQLSGFATADQTKKQILMSEHTGLSQNTIARAMALETVQDDDAFQETITLLRAIRKTL